MGEAVDEGDEREVECWNHLLSLLPRPPLVVVVAVVVVLLWARPRTRVLGVLRPDILN